MLADGSDLWHTSSDRALAWGANFGPATLDAQWWRLGSALFLHFGALHLLMNMWALWDAGQLVERMYGPLRFAGIYFFSGLCGNLLSLISQHGQSVSAGASGAIFGIYAALLLFLWHERTMLRGHEFRWLFIGAAVFAGISIGLGLLLPGIDNAAHSGGLLAGLLSAACLRQPLMPGSTLGRREHWLAGSFSLLLLLLLISQLPAPAYRWQEESIARQALGDFLRADAAISQNWHELLREGQQGELSFDELAGRLESDVGAPYEASFAQLSAINADPTLPSAASLYTLRQYAGLRRDASRTLADGLRHQDARKIRQAMALDRQSRALQTASATKQ
jgi:rhomboid protease GluP